MEDNKRLPNIKFTARRFEENGKIRGPLFGRNLRGEVSQFNMEGKRRFCVYLDPNALNLDLMDEDGLPVKWTRPRKDDPNPEEFVPKPYFEVEAQYVKKDGTPAMYPPTISVVTENGPIYYDESMLNEVFDKARIEYVTLELYPRWYDFMNRKGYKMILRKAEFKFEDDDSGDTTYWER